MSATNATPIINLPLFIGTDKPAWLVDWNGAMNTIDTAIANLQTAESGTATSLASLAQSVEALSGTVSQHTTAIQTVTNATAGNTGSINTINSLIGNGKPTTTDKTIIGAINEIYADIGAGDGVDADEVNYDNTSSGLQATDVQAAIDEVNGKIPSITTPDAKDVSYDNTSSGLTASNVQAAIDELAQGGAVGTVSTLASVTAADSSIVVPDLNGFKFIQICTTNAAHTEIDGATILPVSVFKTMTVTEAVRASYDTTYASVHYVDDTHISIDHVTSGEGAVVYAW